MPGLAVDLVEEDIGYLSSSTSAFTAAPGKCLRPSSVSSTKPSLDEVNASSPKRHISSPNALSQFPTDNDISPFCTPPVLLRVGGPKSPSAETEPVTFFVHEKLLSRASAFFRSALSPRNNPASRNISDSTYSFLEAQTRTIDLPEDRPDDVRFFLRWLYHVFCAGNLPITSSSTTTHTFKSSSPRPPQSDTKPVTACPSAPLNDSINRSALLDPSTLRGLHRCTTYNRERQLLSRAKRHGDISQLLLPRPKPPAFGPLIRLYIFADKYQVGLGLRDLICDLVKEVAKVGNAVPNCDDVWLLYANTWSGEGEVALVGLRKLIVDLYMGMKTQKLLAREEKDEDGDEGWHGGFLRDLVEGWRLEYLGLVVPQLEKKSGRGWEAKTGQGNGNGNGKASHGHSNKKASAEELDCTKGREMVKIGRLSRQTCDYHEHHL